MYLNAGKPEGANGHGCTCRVCGHRYAELYRLPEKICSECRWDLVVAQVVKFEQAEQAAILPITADHVSVRAMVGYRDRRPNGRHTRNIEWKKIRPVQFTNT